MDEVTCKLSLKKERDAKVVANICLVTGDEADGNRGLSVSAYLKFHRTMMSLPIVERSAWEDHQIREGRILAAGEIANIKNPNPFVEKNS